MKENLLKIILFFSITAVSLAYAEPRLQNIATRGFVGVGDNVLIGGIVISGAEPKTVVIRARGPALANAGLSGTLADPQMALFSGASVIDSNNDWQGHINASMVPEDLQPSDEKESVIVRTLSPGDYTAIVSGVSNTTGIGLVEVYELEDTGETRLTNIATRGFVGTGDNVLIGGFVISGTDTQSLVIRAKGPSLADAGVSGVLTDPQMTLLSGATVITSNNNWRDHERVSEIPAEFQPTRAVESAIYTELGPGAYTVVMSGVGGESGVGIVEVFAIEPLFTEAAKDLFASVISPKVIETRCIACHIAGGLSGHTRLVFEAGDSESLTNMAVLEDFISTINGGGDLLLDKIRGVAHGGGVQLSGESSDYIEFDRFLTLLGNQSSAITVSVDTFYNSFTPLSPTLTFRKAVELLQGRQATKDEIVELGVGDEDTLRRMIRGLMQGTAFKEFVRVNANDILLTDGTIEIQDSYDPVRFLDGWAYSLQVFLDTGDEPLALRIRNNFVGDFVKRQPLELINYLIERELPYTEILTADYMMVNPVINITYQAGALFDDDHDLEEWKPGRINNYILHNENAQYRESSSPFSDTVLSGGDILDYPHAGILNTTAFMGRYPSTPTNRNRARSRWTQFFFLGLDIEASAARTTDPTALADRDNPTLNNPACTVCHTIMDPVAGAYQNYGHRFGWYRDNEGRHSLDHFYIFPQDGTETLYQQGDNWYRDMLVPGFEDKVAPDASNSLQWLAQEIVADPRFSTATVKFWWSAIYGTTPLLAPAVTTDFDFAEHLVAFEVENSAINDLAEGFSSGFSEFGSFNLKDLLVEMMLSPRFTALNLEDTSEAERSAYRGIGPGRILSPEAMQQKLEDSLGFEWIQFYDQEQNRTFPYLSSDFLYYFLYGGIDSIGITERPLDYSTVMRTITELLGNSGSKGILGNDLFKKQSDRILLPLVEIYTDPNTIKRESFELEGDGESAKTTKSITVDLGAGNQILTIRFDNGQNNGLSRFNFESLDVRNSQGGEVFTLDVPNMFQIQGVEVPCGEFGHDSQGNRTHYKLNANCEVRIPVTLSVEDTYTIAASVWANQSEETNVVFALGADSSSDIKTSSSQGAQDIRQNVGLLMNRIWKKDWPLDHEEIQIAYDLWVDLYIASRNSDDDFFGEDFDGFRTRPEISSSLTEEGFNNTQTLEKAYLENYYYRHQIMAWRGLISYLVSDFEFIYQ
jgi:hypothetical protein